MKKFLLLAALACGLVACGPQQKLVYDYDAIQPVSKTMPYSVTVQINDTRDNADMFSKFPLDADHEVVYEDTRRCVNAENEYADTIGTKFNQLLSDHLRMARAFKDVSINPEDGEYTLKGNLRTLFGYQDYSYGSAVAASFGLFGALANSDNKTPGVITIEIVDLKFMKGGEVVKDLGSFKKVYKDEYAIDAYCWFIYAHVNEAVKKFNGELVDYIREQLEGETF
ncbi:MAG: hypothetical protein HUK20_05575 [Fibrobacter sp.]|nr:hypothetical protein [Fibrobacter sp.]